MQSTMDLICGRISYFDALDGVSDDVSILEPLFSFGGSFDACEPHHPQNHHQQQESQRGGYVSHETTSRQYVQFDYFSSRGSATTPELLCGLMRGSGDSGGDGDTVMLLDEEQDEDDQDYDCYDANSSQQQQQPIVKVLVSQSDDSKSHSLTPDLMSKLQGYLPPSKRGESFWLLYSLVRDGASIDTLLRNVEDSLHTLLVVETMDGEVFGAFTSRPWKIRQDFYGTGESFLWRVVDNGQAIVPEGFQFEKKNDTKVDSGHGANLIDSDDTTKDNDHNSHHHHHHDLEVFKYAFRNPCIQLCHADRIALGGGEEVTTRNETKYGFGLAFDKDLLRGTTSSCNTFDSPPLSKKHADGSWFEVANLEMWAMTPFETLMEAEKMAGCRKALQHQSSSCFVSAAAASSHQRKR
jgi:hypothetical protein